MSLHDFFGEFMSVSEFLWNSEEFAAAILIVLTCLVIFTIVDVIRRDRR